MKRTVALDKNNKQNGILSENYREISCLTLLERHFNSGNYPIQMGIMNLWFF
jgi:hypothetical protein